MIIVMIQIITILIITIIIITIIIVITIIKYDTKGNYRMKIQFS
jgi:hypothetical protein